MEQKQPFSLYNSICNTTHPQSKRKHSYDDEQQEDQQPYIKRSSNSIYNPSNQADVLLQQAQYLQIQNQEQATMMLQQATQNHQQQAQRQQTQDVVMQTGDQQGTSMGCYPQYLPPAAEEMVDFDDDELYGSCCVAGYEYNSRM